MTLLKSQKNAIYKAIQEAGLNPQDFRWEMRDGFAVIGLSGDTETLVHVGSGFWCMIANAPVGRSDNARPYESYGDYLFGCEPGEDSRIDGLTGLSMSSALERIRTWAHNLHREITEPDLWAQLAAEGQEFTEALGTLNVDNTPFTRTEVRRISEGLDEVRAQLTAQHDLTEHQLKAIDKAIAALKAASERVGRKDWVLMFGGTLLGIVANAALPPETVKGLFHIVGQVFQWLLQSGRLLPPLT